MSSLRPIVRQKVDQRIAWVLCHMSILRQLEETFRLEKPLHGLRVVVSVHIETKTAYLAWLLRSVGAQVAVTGSNPDSTKDEMVAALAAEGLHVYARYGASPARNLHDARNR